MKQTTSFSSTLYNHTKSVWHFPKSTEVRGNNIASWLKKQRLCVHFMGGILVPLRFSSKILLKALLYWYAMTTNKKALIIGCRSTYIANVGQTLFSGIQSFLVTVILHFFFCYPTGESLTLLGILQPRELK